MSNTATRYNTLTRGKRLVVDTAPTGPEFAVLVAEPISDPMPVVSYALAIHKVGDGFGDDMRHVDTVEDTAGVTWYVFERMV